MKNYILLVVILILLPICIISNKDSTIIVSIDYKGNNLKLSLDDYLIGVLGAEMPASFNMEALKAQAIASRTYLLYEKHSNEIITNTNEQAYLDNNDLKDKWKDDYEIYYNKIKDAVLDTKDLVITYDNKLIKSYYYAISNGLTESSIEVFNEDRPYLQITDSSFDENVNSFNKTMTVERNEFCKILNIDCNNIVISNIIKDESNRIKNITINNKEFKGTEIRKLLNLRSTDFEIIEDDNIKIITKGYGHGVGMSQYGANYLANNNYKYEEILKYYYKDVEIKKWYKNN